MVKAANSISVAEYRALQADSQKRKNKFSAKRVTNQHGSFDSRGEALRYAHLELQQRLGLIRDLRQQVRFPLYCGKKPLLFPSQNGRKPHHVCYIADFTYEIVENDKFVIEDFKGIDTQVSRLKRAVLATMMVVEILITGKPAKNAHSSHKLPITGSGKSVHQRRRTLSKKIAEVPPL